MAERTPQELSRLERSVDPLLNQLSPTANFILGVSVGAIERTGVRVATTARKVGRGLLDIVQHPDSKR